jgi:dTDP-4-amino-4,6-dideoxygalactose transaminase
MKSFAAGELGIMVTDDRKYYERGIAFAHYERNNPSHIKECTELAPYAMIALGGLKGRANQVCTAMARVQLKYYDERCAEIRKAMNYFWDQLEQIPGLHAIRVDESTGSNMAGWYCPQGIYHPEELGGLSVKRFCAAMRAEGVDCCWEGANYCLHTHAFFKTFDLHNAGKPTRIAYNDRDVREDDEKCRPSENILCFQIPWFKHFDKEWIDKYVAAFKKVADRYEELLVDDDDKSQGGRWFGVAN